MIAPFREKCFAPAYFARLSAIVRRDFLRFAVARVMTPDLTALSIVESVSDKDFVASSFLPAMTVSRNPFSTRRRREEMERLCNCLRALLRTLFSADFVFGINRF